MCQREKASAEAEKGNMQPSSTQQLLHVFLSVPCLSGQCRSAHVWLSWDTPQTRRPGLGEQDLLVPGALDTLTEEMLQEARRADSHLIEDKTAEHSGVKADTFDGLMHGTLWRWRG